MTADMTRYAYARTCVCGGLIEEIQEVDSPVGGPRYTFWAHVKRMRIDFDHSAVPDPESGR
jgi:hypothetical protein